MNSLSEKLNALIDSQLKIWPTAGENYAKLADVRVKTLSPGGYPVRVQFNPARIVSTGAKVDAAAIKARPCFLCAQNRPAVQEGISWNDYEILVNPFPIFPRHLTIPAREHMPQRIAGRLADMGRLALDLEGYTVFYNGPRCGASAPDHMHFQAGNSDFLPVWNWLYDADLEEIYDDSETIIVRTKGLPINFFVLESENIETLEKEFNRVYSSLPETDEEPMVNILCRTVGEGRVQLLIIPRKKHRPANYGTEEGQILVSPASVDLGGVLITPLESNFEELDEEKVQKIFDEVCLSDSEIDAIAAKIKKAKEPIVTVGIMSAKTIRFNLKGTFQVEEYEASDLQEVSISDDGKSVVWNGDEYPALTFSPIDGAVFELKDVTIGVNFHWERLENQTFKGSLTLKPIDGAVTAINEILVEDYLASVISSEMSATASLELLKAHAVISRSWLLAQIDKSDSAGEKFCSHTETEEERVRWYDREDHTHFDVCADDHCQRYQGITRATTPEVQAAIDATRGEVLTTDDGELCDARFSKCCGGVFEEFENCWEPVHHSYLEAARDSEDEDDFPDLSIERNAEEWILSRPSAFCNTADKEILSQVLNNYDQETTDFYRWQVELSREEIARLVRERSGIDFGEVKDLVPVERGTSGRLVRLEIVGTKCSKIIGKELEIRRTLSPSHLYSSAFVVEKGRKDEAGIPEKFILHGAGWGHGVGLCQIGAAVMGARGYDYRTILLHYFKNANITRLYQ